MTDRDTIEKALHRIYDPELGLDIVELGLVYGIEIEGGAITIHMTLTTRGCPLHDAMIPAVEQVVGGLDGVEHVIVDLVWDPPWTPDRMSPLAAAALGFAPRATRAGR